MADQFQYGGLGHGQGAGYPPFPQYANVGADQGAQFIQGYALAQQGNPNANPAAPMFGGQSFDQNPYQQGGPGGMPMQQLGAQLNAAGLGGGFPYGDYSQFNQYGHGGGAGMAQPMNDMQQYGQMMPNNINAGQIYEALAQEQGLAGFNAAAFFQEQAGNMNRNIGVGGGFPGKGFGMNQRAGMNKFGSGGRQSNLPSVTNPDGLRDDTVFVSKLPQNIDHDIMKSQFGEIGKIKTNAKTGMPMIWIFKERGIPKGEALVTFEDSSCVQKAIKWFLEKDFLGKKIDVKQAKNSQRPVIIPSGPPGQGGNTGGGGGGGQNSANALAAAAVAAAASGNSMSSLMSNSPSAAAAFATLGGGGPGDRPVDMYGGGPGAQFGPRGDGPMMGGPRGGGGPGMRPHMGNRPPMRGGREGDWPCPQCNNHNFSYRDQCKQCGAPRPDEGIMPMMPSYQRGGPPNNGPMFPGAGGPGPMPRGGGHMMGGMGGGMMGGGPGGRGGMMNGGRGGLGGGGMQMRGRGGGPMRGGMAGGARMRPGPY